MKRLDAVDSLRGGLLVMMALNHVPSDARVVTDQPLGYVSAAEGFVFLSGLLAGKVYSHKMRSYGLPEAAASALARALHIYRAHLICIALVLAWCVAHALVAGGPAPGSPELFAERPLASVLAAALFVYRPGLLDILPIYCLCFVVMPLLLAAAKHGFEALAIATSFALWATANLIGKGEPFVEGLVNTGALRIGAWQLLFVLGVLLGHRWSTGQRVLAPRGFALGPLVAAACVLAATRHGWLPALQPWAAELTNKATLGPLRLVDVALVFTLIAFAVRARSEWFTWAPLTFLGQHSLVVFTTHVVVAEVILGLPQYFDTGAIPRVTGNFLLLAAMFAAAAVRAFVRSARDRWKVPANPPPSPI